MQDFRFALRQLLKNPGFAIVAVLTLALGIGANNVVFSVANAVLLRSPPYREPERLAWLFTSNPSLGIQRLPPNWADEQFSQLLAESTTIAGSAKIRSKEFILQKDERTEPIRGMRASANLFDLLGVRPILGRTFLFEENILGRHRVVLLSHECWQRRFGGDPAILGQTISLIDTELSDRDGTAHDTLDLQSYTVIGVLPKAWRFPTGAVPEGDVGGFGPRAEIWEPESLTPAEQQRRAVLDNIIVRLKPNVTWRQAQAELQTLFRRIQQPFEGHSPGYLLDILPLVQQVQGNSRSSVLLLAGATGFVLLIGCVNLANYLLARASVRRREFAIRLALGASRWRMTRQLLIESLFLSCCGGAVALLLAFLGVKTLRLFGSTHLPRLDEMQLDSSALAFTVLLSLLTTFVFGLMPAIDASRKTKIESLTVGARDATSGAGVQRMRSSLVVAEIALSVLLLAGAGLLIRSFVRLLNVDAGFQAERLLVRALPFRHPHYQSNDVALRIEVLLERVRAIPGIQSAAVSSWLPIDGGPSRFASAFQIEGRPALEPGRLDNLTVANMSFVSANYFKTMGIPLLKGRDFTSADLAPGAPPVKIVSVSFVPKFFRGEEPLGKRVAGGEIIGIVKDTRESGLQFSPEPHLYHAGIHTGPLGLRSASLVVRAQAQPNTIAASVENAVLEWDRNQPLLGTAGMKEIISESVATRRFQMLLTGFFAGLALLLAAIGIFGVLSYTVAQKTNEIGIRMALGAGRRAVLGLILSYGMRLTMSGIILGLLAAFMLTRMMRGFLFEITPHDPATFAAIALLLAAVALLACWLPARRAAQLDPVDALRYE